MINDFGHWIPALAGMPVFVNTPCWYQLPLRAEEGVGNLVATPANPGPSPSPLMGEGWGEGEIRHPIEIATSLRLLAMTD